MVWSGGAILPALAAACGALLVQDASAQSCKGFLQTARASIGNDVAALRHLEHEASDRLKGLDSRPFAALRDDAKKTAAIIGNPGVLKLEESLRGCRNWTRPVHKICFEAGQALVDVLEKYVASPRQDYDKAAFATAVAECERLMDLKPLKSALRGTD
jgi:hypothetical protein